MKKFKEISEGHLREISEEVNLSEVMYDSLSINDNVVFIARTKSDCVSLMNCKNEFVFFSFDNYKDLERINAIFHSFKLLNQRQKHMTVVGNG